MQIRTDSLIKDYCIHDKHPRVQLLIILMLLSFPVGSRFFFPSEKAWRAEHRPSDECWGKLWQRCALIRGRWYPQRKFYPSLVVSQTISNTKGSTEPSDILFRIGWGSSVFCCFFFPNRLLMCFKTCRWMKQWYHRHNTCFQAIEVEYSCCYAHVLATNSCQVSMNWNVLEATVLRQVLFGDISRGQTFPHRCEKVGRRTQAKITMVEEAHTDTGNDLKASQSINNPI